LGPLGLEYIYRYGVPDEYREPQRPGRFSGVNTAIGGDRKALRAWATLQHPVISIGEVQTLFVYVVNEERQPVQGAKVTAVVRYPSGEEEFSLPPTDRRGITQVSFRVSPTRLGKRVVVEITVEYWDAETTTETFFLPW